MDVHWVAGLRGLPACRVLPQVRGPQPRDVPLERRDDHLVWPHGGPCGARVQASRPRGRRDLPILAPPVRRWRPLRRWEGPECRQRPGETRKTCGARTPWTQRLSHPGRTACWRGGPGDALARRYGLSARTGFRWTFARSRGGRPRQLGRALSLDAEARRQGHPANTLIVAWEPGQPMAPVQGRGADDVMPWLPSRPPAERTKVAGVG